MWNIINIIIIIFMILICGMRKFFDCVYSLICQNDIMFIIFSLPLFRLVCCACLPLRVTLVRSVFESNFRADFLRA